MLSKLKDTSQTKKSRFEQEIENQRQIPNPKDKREKRQWHITVSRSEKTEDRKPRDVHATEPKQFPGLGVLAHSLPPTSDVRLYEIA